MKNTIVLLSTLILCAVANASELTCKTENCIPYGDLANDTCENESLRPGDVELIVSEDNTAELKSEQNGISNVGLVFASGGKGGFIIEENKNNRRSEGVSGVLAWDGRQSRLFFKLSATDLIVNDLTCTLNK